MILKYIQKHAQKIKLFNLLNVIYNQNMIFLRLVQNQASD